MEKNKFQLFLEQSKFQSPIINNADLEYVLVDDKAKKWTFHLTLDAMLEPEVLLPFIDQLKSYFKIPKVVQKVEAKINYKDQSKINDLVCKYYDYAVIELAKEKASFLVLKNFKSIYEDDQIKVLIDKDSTYVKQYFKYIQK